MADLDKILKNIVSKIVQPSELTHLYQVRKFLDNTIDNVPFGEYTVIVTDETIDRLKSTMPELPDERAKRFVSQYKLSDYDADILSSDSAMAEFCKLAKLAVNRFAASAL
mgnify:CR=1 FL=1